MTTERKTALVLGATGGIGGEVAAALLRRGWRVRGLTRSARTGGGVEWLGGDAMDREAVVRAAEGAELIFHGVNPPGYRNWGALVLPMLDNTLAAAGASGADILFPGTVYNYGPDAGALVAEDAPQRPLTRKGAIRVEMERRLRRAADRYGVRSLVVRAGDFFGPTAANSWFSQGIVKPGEPLRKLVAPGPLDVGHAWAYLPDLAETMVRLAERRDELQPFDRFHFEGCWFGAMGQMMEAVRRAADDPHLPVHPMSWPLMHAVAPFVPTVKELLEMRYLWQAPLRLDNAKLRAFLGAETHTSVDQALRTTLEALGCLPMRVAA